MIAVEKLAEFWKKNEHLGHQFCWLRGRNSSDAFVICIGAGPWKFNRRKAIQGKALEILHGRDVTHLTEEEVWGMYPLQWQRDFVLTAIRKLKEEYSNVHFDFFCRLLWGRTDAIQSMRKLVGTKEAKVISLFCRDALCVPSFPIDRHVKRKLTELGLPTKEDAMIQLCRDAGIDPRKVAVAFVRAASDMDNPNWSVDDR